MKKLILKGQRIIVNKTDRKKPVVLNLNEMQDYDIPALQREMTRFGVSERDFALAKLVAEQGGVGVLNGFASSAATEIYTLGTLEIREVVRTGGVDGAFMVLPSDIL